MAVNKTESKRQCAAADQQGKEMLVSVGSNLQLTA